MPSNQSRRGFLVLCSTAALSGCTALADAESEDVVAGVEWKSIRAVRNDRSRSVVDNQPVDTVEHRAPVALALRNHVLDEEVLSAHNVSFPETGSLVIGEKQATRLDDMYDEITYTIVLTLYEREDVVGVPLGNAYGYRITRAAFDRIDPGDRVVLHVGRKDDLPWITELVDVTSV